MLVPALVLLASVTSATTGSLPSLPSLPPLPPWSEPWTVSVAPALPSSSPSSFESELEKQAIAMGVPPSPSSVESELKEQVAALRAECASLKGELALLKAGTAHQQPPGGVAHGPSVAHQTGEYNAIGVLQATVTRSGWLAVFLLSLSLTSVVLSGFEHTLQSQVELSYFVPLLIGHGGNAGGQTIGTVLAGLSSGELKQRDWLRVLTKECLTGVGVGVVIALATVPLLTTLRISWHVSLAILVTLPALTVLSLAIAAGLPFACVALGQNPTVIAAPAMTTLVDVGGLILYFMIAHAVFHVFGIPLGLGAVPHASTLQ